ncbi:MULTISPECIES: hypothetical protein [Pandoraea]|uniref:hypothetical protein n=1 Tax=Pandoraea TaxID=93217 RepID=UPI001F5C787D|nr:MULTISPECIES: hypothetical protein [Pandoraea]MCI3205536.1 hypothetical protein [Pandoraea sp. LA3]MDN4583564.1 hypothetical protein [Pandoraea capi]
MNIRDASLFPELSRLSADEERADTRVLQAPRVPDAETWGGIGYRSLHNIGQPITVLVPWANEFERNDTLRLYWGRADLVAHAIIITNADDTSYQMEVQVQHVLNQDDGEVEVWYELVSNISGEVTRSPPALIRVKRTIPGGLDPDQSTPPINERLALAVLPAGPIEPPIPPEGIALTIPRWLNMAQGDRLTVYWGSQSLPVKTISLDEVDTDIVVMVDEETIKEAGDGEDMAVTYDVYDVVTNYSLRAPPAFIEVEVGDSIYAPPALVGAPGGVLDFDALDGRDVMAIAMVNGDLTDGDTLELVFDGRSYDGLPVMFSVTASWTDPMTEFMLANASLAPVVPGEGSIFYRVTDSSGTSKGRSRRTYYTITGASQSLPAPVVREANGEELDPTLAPDGAHVDIAEWEGMAEDNIVTVHWIGTAVDGTPVTHQESVTLDDTHIGETVTFVVPKSKVDALAGGTVDVYYTVLSGTSLRQSEPITLSVLSTVELPPPYVVSEADGEYDPGPGPDGALMVIPQWPSMAEGDSVTWFWLGTSDGGQETKTVQVSTVGHVEVPISRGVVEANANGGDTVTVLYRIKRASGAEQDSESYQFKVLPLPPVRLPAPLVEEAVDGVLDPSDAVDDATVTVKAYPGMARDDVVTVWFAKGTVGEFTRTFFVSDNTVGQDIAMYVPHENVVLVDGLIVTVNYTVKVGDVVTPSEDLLLEVSTAIQWPAPYVREADGDYLPEEAYGRGATTVVSWHEGMKVDDMLDIYWGEGADEYHDSIRIVGPMDYELIVPKSVVDRFLMQEVPVYYTITRGNRVMESEVLNLRVGLFLPTLGAPEVAEAQQGVLKPTDARDGATVVITYEDMQVTDKIQLSWDGDTSFAEASGDPSGTLEIVVPPGKVAMSLGRTVPVMYTLKRGEKEIDSDTLNLTVNNFVPTNLPLANVVEQEDGVVSLPSFTGDATVRQPSWPLMAAGQRIWVRVLGTLDTDRPTTITLENGHVVTEAEGGKPFNSVLERADLEKLKDGSELRIEVKVTFDGSDNEDDAVPFRVRTLRIAHTLPLPEPLVVDAPDGELDAIDALDGVTVRVQYDDMEPTDLIELVWDGGSDFGQVPGTAAGFVDIEVDADKVLAYIGKTVTVHYMVIRESGYYASGVLDLTVNEFEPGDLPTPEIPQADGGVLRLADFDGDPRVTVEPWRAIAVGQKVWLRVHGTLANGQSDTIVLWQASGVTAGEVTAGLSKAIPRARLEALKDASDLRVEMKVTFDGGSDEAQASLFPELRLKIEVAPDLGVEPSQMVLNGLAVRQDGWPSTGRDAPGNTGTRVGTGGVPPYTYSSSRPSVATVNGAGKVSGIGNGSATITIRDSRGATVSYPVVVSNVYRFAFNQNYGISYSQAIAWANSLGGRGIAHTEIELLKSLYVQGYYPDGASYYYWSCTNSTCGANSSMMIDIWYLTISCSTPGSGGTTHAKAACLVPRNG